MPREPTWRWRNSPLPMSAWKSNNKATARGAASALAARSLRRRDTLSRTAAFYRPTVMGRQVADQFKAGLGVSTYLLLFSHSSRVNGVSGSRCLVDSAEFKPDISFANQASKSFTKSQAHAIDPLHGKRHVAKQIVKLHGKIELRLAILDRRFRTRIGSDLQLRRVDVLVLGHLHCISARQHARARGSTEGRAGRGWHSRCFQTHGPGGPIQYAAFTAGHRG